MAEIKMKNSEILSNEKYVLKRVNYEIKKKDGQWKEESKEVFDHGNAVTALLYNKEKRTIILTRQFRIATYVNGNKEGMLTEVCAGLLEEGETPEETMKREIEEETGYVLSELKKVYEAYTSAGSLTEKVFFFIAGYNESQRKSKGGGLQEEGEEIDVLELPFDQVIADLKAGKIQDVKTIVLLQYALLHQLL